MYTLTLDDGHGGTTSQDVTITALGTDDVPVLNWVPGSITAYVGVPVSIDIPVPPTSDIVTDVDAGSDLLKVSLFGGFGTLALSQYALNSGIQMVDSDGSDGSLSFLGTLAQINAALALPGFATYTPGAFPGGPGSGPSTFPANLSVQIDDGHGGFASQILNITVNSNMPAPTASADSTVTIAPDNELAPVFRNLNLSDAQGTIDHATVTWHVPSGGAIGGLPNTTNPGGITADAILDANNNIIGYNYHGVASVADYQTALGYLGFANTSNETGDTFTLTINDGVQDSTPITVNVNVAPPSDWYVWNSDVNGTDWKVGNNWIHQFAAVAPPALTAPTDTPTEKVYIDTDGGNPVDLSINSEQAYGFVDLNIQSGSELDISSTANDPGSATVTGALLNFGTIHVTDAILNVPTDANGANNQGDIEAESGAVITFGGPAVLTLYNNSNTATIGAQGGGTVIFDHATVNGGILQSTGGDADTQSIIKFNDAILDHLTLTSPNNDSAPTPFGFEVLNDHQGGVTLFDGTGTDPSSPFVITGGAVVNIDAGASLKLGGTIQDAGTIIVDGLTSTTGSLLIEDEVTLNGGGHIKLAGPNDQIVGDGSSQSNTLDNVNVSIHGLGGTIGGGHLDVINEHDGIISSNGSNDTLFINTNHDSVTDQGTLINHGLVASIAEGGLEITGDVANDGTLEARDGLLKVDGDVVSSTAGAGHALIDGGTMEFDGASNAQVQFATVSQDRLVLGHGSSFTGSVTGLSDGDSIDIAGVAPGSVQVGQHSVTYGSTTFAIDGNYPTDHLVANTDDNGGTLLTWTDVAPVIDTTSFTLAHVGSATTIAGLAVSDVDTSSDETYQVDAMTGAAPLTSVSVTNGAGTLAQINAALAHGVAYDAGAQPPDQDSVTVNVTDGSGQSDSVNFIFNLADPPENDPHVTMTGTAGKDVIFATGNPDTLTGGGGADQFVFQSGAAVGGGGTGQDTITDFTAGTDKIDLRFYADAPDATSLATWLAGHAHDQGNGDTLIDLDQSQTRTDTILLKNVALQNLHASDFIVHPGTGSA